MSIKASHLWYPCMDIDVMSIYIYIYQVHDNMHAWPMILFRIVVESAVQVATHLHSISALTGY